MTLAVRLSVNKYPLLVADLLLSSEETEKASIIHVPTVGNHTQIFPQGCGYTITGLRQKIALIGDNLAIAWAGNRIFAKTIIKEMIVINTDNPFTIDTLSTYFSNLPSIETNGVHFIGHVKKGRRVSGFGFKSKEFTSTRFGKVGLLGTGANDLEDILKEFPNITSEGVKSNHLWEAYLLGLITSGFMLRMEMQTCKSLLQYYGGGYEILSLVGENFQKLGDATFVFWEATIEGDKVRFTLLPRSFRYSYQGDVLLIQTATIDEIGDGESRVTLNQVIDIVPPIYREVSNEETQMFPPLEMKSRITCNYFLIRFPNGVTQVLARIQSAAIDSSPTNLVEEKDGGYIWRFDQKQMSEVTEDILRQFRALRKSGL